MIRCFKYYAVPASLADAQALRQQMRLGGDYRRALVELENRKRVLLMSLWAEPMRHIPVDERKIWRDAGGDAELIANRKSDQYKVWQRKIEDISRAQSKELRTAARATGVGWGTTGQVDESMEAAKRATKLDQLKHAPVRRVAVQIIGSTGDEIAPTALSVERIFDGEDTRLRVGRDLYALGANVDGYKARADGEVLNRGGNVRPARFCEVGIRIGSTQSREPVWVKAHVLMHRDLPKGFFKIAWLQHEKVGGRDAWQMIFVVDVKEVMTPKPAKLDHSVAIDLGWRRRLSGIRVAYMLADDGNEKELIIPDQVLRRKIKSDDLQSIRDMRRNEYAVRLRGFASTGPLWLNEATAHILQWIRVGHFYKLLALWNLNRFNGDEQAYTDLQEHLKKERHLFSWEQYNVRKMRRQIAAKYDDFAHFLCSTYKVVVIEDLRVSDIARKDESGVADRSISVLSPAELLESIRKASTKYDCVVQHIDPKNTTRTCSKCGELRDSARSLDITCKKCGLVEDQDLTACKNLLAASAMMLHNAGEVLEVKKTVKNKQLRTRSNRKRVASSPFTEVLENKDSNI
jgi:hypothetical protein